MYTNICVHKRERESEGVGTKKETVGLNIQTSIKNSFKRNAHTCGGCMHAYAALNCKKIMHTHTCV